MLTEQYFGQSGSNLLNTIVNKGGPYSTIFKYILDNNSIEKINNVIESLLAYLAENGITEEQITDPYFFTKNEVMIGGMRITPIIAACLITVRVVSGHETIAGSILETGGIIAITGVASAVEVGRALFNIVGHATRASAATYDAWRPPNHEEIDELRKDKVRLEELARKLQEEVDRKSREEEARKLQEELARAKTQQDRERLISGAILTIVTGVLAGCGLTTSCKNKTGNLPPVNLNKLRRKSVVKYNFDQPIGSVYIFHTLEEACTAVSEGYPLYFERDGIWKRVDTWDELNHFFSENIKIATKYDPTKGGTKRRRRRRSTKRSKF